MEKWHFLLLSRKSWDWTNVCTGCPKELQLVDGEAGVVACKSACEAFGLDEYCCSGEFGSPQTCRPSFYSTIFKTACPRAYSYAYDDGSSTFTCKAYDYSLTFCPTVSGSVSTLSSVLMDWFLFLHQEKMKNIWIYFLCYLLMHNLNYMYGIPQYLWDQKIRGCSIHTSYWWAQSRRGRRNTLLSFKFPLLALALFSFDPLGISLLCMILQQKYLFSLPCGWFLHMKFINFISWMEKDCIENKPLKCTWTCNYLSSSFNYGTTIPYRHLLIRNAIKKSFQTLMH